MLPARLTESFQDISVNQFIRLDKREYFWISGLIFRNEKCKPAKSQTVLGLYFFISGSLSLNFLMVKHAAFSTQLQSVVKASSFSLHLDKLNETGYNYCQNVVLVHWILCTWLKHQLTSTRKKIQEQSCVFLYLRHDVGLLGRLIRVVLRLLSYWKVFLHFSCEIFVNPDTLQ